MCWPWATMVAVTAVFDVADPVRITLFAAGAAFEGALLAPDPQPGTVSAPSDGHQVCAAVAVVVTVALAPDRGVVAAALLVLPMFSSYALRSWSPRVASLAPKPIEPQLLHDVDVVVTLGREAHVDPTPGTRLESWDIDEPLNAASMASNACAWSATTSPRASVISTPDSKWVRSNTTEYGGLSNSSVGSASALADRA